MNVDAALQEMGTQRAILGDRAVQLAGLLATANEEIRTLKKRIAELEEKKAAPPTL